MTYHVVCHDCDAETLQNDSIAAMTLKEMHESEYSHNVEYAQIE